MLLRSTKLFQPRLISSLGFTPNSALVVNNNNGQSIVKFNANNSSATSYSTSNNAAKSATTTPSSSAVTQYKAFHFSSIGMATILPLSIFLPTSVITMAADLALTLVLPVHFYLGMNAVVNDYIYSKAPRLLAVFLVFSVQFLYKLKLDHDLNTRIKFNDHDNEGLTVLVIPHSHCDSGWLYTYQEYSYPTVMSIIGSVIDVLENDRSKTFQWAEIGFFKNWWNQQGDEKRESVKRLIKNKQLEFIGGGWVQNDEATANIDDVIEQMTEGHQWLREHLNYTVDIAWQIDPFGHSSLTPSLFSRMGFKAMIGNRVSQTTKDYMKSNNHLRYVWQGSKNLGERSDMFVHTLHDHYSYPEGVEDITTENTQETANSFVRQLNRMSHFYKSKVLMVVFGDDFRYRYAHQEFKRNDMLMNYVIQHKKQYGIKEIRYSTLSEYFTLAEKDLRTRNQSVPVFYKDFFPYITDYVDPWTGYYTTHPRLKRQIRDVSSLLRTVDVFYSLLTSTLSTTSKSLESLMGLYYDIEESRQSLSITQHHDSVTGTARSYVMKDYLDSLTDYRKRLLNVLSNSMDALLNKNNDDSRFETANVIKVEDADEIISVVVQNSLAWSRKEHYSVRIQVKDRELVKRIQILDQNKQPKLIQIVPVSYFSSCQNENYNIYFIVDLPAMGVSTYFLSVKPKNSGTTDSPLSKITVFESQSKFETFSKNLRLMSNVYSVKFAKNGFIDSFTRKWEHPSREELYFSVKEKIQQYQTKKSGAYLFLPTYKYPYLDKDQKYFALVEGPLVNMLVIFYGDQCQPSSIILHRLYTRPRSNHDDEGPLITEQFVEGGFSLVGDPNRETVFNFATSMDADSTFYTDNGLESRERVFTSSTPINEKYYPSLHYTHMKDYDAQFTVFHDRSVGSSMLANGELEFMVHRNLQQDDWKGLSWPNRDNARTDGSFYLNYDKIEYFAPMQRKFSLHLENNPSFVIYRTKNIEKYISNYELSYSPMKFDFPDNLHLLSLKYYQNLNEIGFRVLHLLPSGLDSSLAVPQSIDPQFIFNNYKIDSIKETGMTFMEQREFNNFKNLTSNEDTQMPEISGYPEYSPSETPKYHSKPSKFTQDSITVLPLEINSFLIKLDPTTTPRPDNLIFKPYTPYLETNRYVRDFSVYEIDRSSYEDRGKYHLILCFSNTINSQTCSTNPSWRDLNLGCPPTSPSVITQNPETVYPFGSPSDWKVMAWYDHEETSLTVASGSSNGVPVSSALKLDLSVWGPTSFMLVSRNPPSLKGNKLYRMDFDFLLGQTQSLYNTISNVSVYLTPKIDTIGPYTGNLLSPSDYYVRSTIQGDWSSNTSWSTKSISFTPTVDAGDASLVIQLNFTQQTGPTPLSYYFNNLRLTVPTSPVVQPTLLTKDTELFTLPKMAAALDAQDRDTCPYLQCGLKHWHDPATWGGAVPSPSSTITLPANTKVLVSSCSMSSTLVYQKIIIPESSELIFSDADITINVRDIMVNGKLTIGTPTCRYNSKIYIIFHGAKTTSDTIGTMYGSKGIGVSSTGSINVHGKQFHRTWTKLAATTWTSDRVIYVQDDVNWEVGQQVVVITSIYEDEYSNQNEVMTIAAIQGRKIQFTEPLKYLHYGGQEYQSEVALLTRRIVLKGASDSDTGQFGGHILIMGEGKISGVQLDKMGQKNIKGRYPLHFHLGTNRPNNYFNDNSVTNSFYRCFTIHGTHGVTVSRNVAFNVFGHCYYLEDGVEENNTLSYNLAAYVHTIGAPAAGSGQPGEDFTESADLRQPADSAASGFYITNAYNRIVGNSASGGWAGFAFPNLKKPIGNHQSVNMDPSTRPNLQFEGNTAHSSGYHWYFGGSIYVGGNLYHDTTSGLLVYQSGRYERETMIGDTPAWMRFTNTKVFLSNSGIDHWGHRIEVVGLEAHDCHRSATLFGQAWMNTAIVNGQSGNPLSKGMMYQRQGFQFYDTYVQTILSNVEFRNYIHNPDPNINYDADDNRAIITMTHSDVFKPQGISATKNIRYVNVPAAQTLGHNVLDTGSSRQFNLIDTDGSMSRRGTPTIVGSHENWWNYNSNVCSFNSMWKTWTCDKLANTEVANIEIIVPNYIDYSYYEPGPHVGNFSLFGNGITDRRTIVVTKNPGITGVTNMGWYWYLNNGSPTSMDIKITQIPFGHNILLAIPYPAGSTFTITSRFIWNNDYDLTLTPATSVAQVRDSAGQKYYFNGSHLYISLYDRTLTGSAEEYFLRDGVKLYIANWNFYYYIRVNCPGAVNGFCPKTSDILPNSW
eukprot:gene649-803_t